jgi:hypothetical protein
MGSTRRLVVALAALGVALCASTGARASSWGAPIAVTPSGFFASQTVPVGLGGLVSVYQEVSDVSEIQARFAPPGGAFGDAELLGGPGSFYPTVDTDALGEAIASWWNEDDDGLRVAISSAGQPFASPTVLTSTGANYSQNAPHLAVSPTGSAVLVFVTSIDGEQHVVASYRPAGGAFGPEEIVAPTGDDADGQVSRSVAINDLGDVVAGYLQDGVAHVATRTPGADGTWQAPQALGARAGGFSWRLPEVGIDALGGAVAVWEEGGDQTNGAATLEAAFSPPGGSFGPAQGLGIQSSDNEEPALGVSALGEVILLARPVFQEVGGVGLEPLVVFSGSTGSGRFAAPAPIGAPLLADGESLAMNAVGDAVIAYGSCCDAGVDRLVALRRGPLGSFGAAEDIAPPYEVPSDEPLFARAAIDTRLDAFGNAAVSWIEAAPAPAGASAPPEPLLVSTDGLLQSTLGALVGPIEGLPATLVQTVSAVLGTVTGGPGPSGEVPALPPATTSVPVAAAPTAAHVAGPTIRTEANRSASGLHMALDTKPAGRLPRVAVHLECPAACLVSFAAAVHPRHARAIPVPIAPSRLAAAGRAVLPVTLTPAARRALAHDRTTLSITATAVNAAGTRAVARATRVI